MSDPVKSMDVEDVLSSIRRLVSEEAKGNVTGFETPSDVVDSDIHQEAENAASDALADLARDDDDGFSAMPIGTPPSNDLADGDDKAAEEDDADHPVSFRHKSVTPRDTSDQRLVLTAAFRVADPEPETETDQFEDLSDAGDAPKVDDTEILTSPRPERPHLRSVISETAEPQPEVQAESRPRAFDYAPEDTLFDRAKRAMDAVKDNRPAAPTRRPDRVTSEPVVKSPEPTDQLEKTPVTTTMEPAAASEPAELVELPDSEGTIDFADTPSPASPFSAGGGVLDQAADEAPDAYADDEPSTINFAEEDESILDEDTLRDIVSEMVRAELQGELGDRITRNVRKLVRREIQRALASREFE